MIAKGYTVRFGMDEEIVSSIETTDHLLSDHALGNQFKTPRLKYNVK
jgi:hypothetical protein